MKFEWKYAQDSLHSASSPEQLKSTIIFRSMHNDIVWEERGKTKNVSRTVANYACILLMERCFLYLDQSSGTCTDKSDGDSTDTEVRGNLPRQHEHKFAELHGPEKLIKLSYKTRLINIEKRQFFQMRIHVENIRHFESKKHPV